MIPLQFLKGNSKHWAVQRTLEKNLEQEYTFFLILKKLQIRYWRQKHKISTLEALNNFCSHKATNVSKDNEQNEWSSSVNEGYCYSLASPGKEQSPYYGSQPSSDFSNSSGSSANMKSKSSSKAPALPPPPPDSGRVSVTAGNCCPLLSDETGQVSLANPRLLLRINKILHEKNQQFTGQSDFKWGHPGPSVLVLRIYKPAGPSCSTAWEAPC